MRLPSALIVLLIALVAGPAAAELSAAGQATLKRVETYLNGVRTFQARFIQVSDNGGIAEGRIYMQRPGKMRIEYKPPVPLILVATGKLIIMYDSKLDQTTHLPLAASPAAWLLGDRLGIHDKIEVTKVSETGGRVYVSLVEKGKATKGTLHLVFLDAPLRLREWIVVDAQRRRTKIVLVDAKEGMKLDPRLFLFERPARPGGDDDTNRR
ncbi:MAG TPA: outer membrane lipoprotein carrier protein LolA [Alphaproteobacteria bacterium]|nr:outer membrane lipoprotein carrier protein LolA [Alphaproteobacteria bacterium]